MIRLKVAAVAAVVGALAGCAVGPDYRPPKPDVPADFATPPTPAPAAGAAAIPAAGADDTIRQWWQSFHDPELTSLVNRAIESNPDLAVALLRLQEARTEEAVVMGLALPA